MVEKKDCKCSVCERIDNTLRKLAHEILRVEADGKNAVVLRLFVPLVPEIIKRASKFRLAKTEKEAFAASQNLFVIVPDLTAHIVGCITANYSDDKEVALDFFDKLRDIINMRLTGLREEFVEAHERRTSPTGHRPHTTVC